MINSVYYAHLLTFHGRVCLLEESASDATSTSSSDVAPVPKIDSRQGLVHGHQAYHMFRTNVQTGFGQIGGTSTIPPLRRVSKTITADRASSYERRPVPK